MKRRNSFIVLAGALFCVFVMLLLAETYVIKVQSTHLKKEPIFFAQTIAVLKNGDKVEKIGAEKGWLKVRTMNNLMGWIHSSAVQTKKINLLAINQSVRSQTSADEIALAGKGFNKQVEESFKARNKEISFVWVDRMLKIKVSTNEILAFLKKGKLGEYGGAK